MKNLLYDLVSRMPYHIPPQQQTLFKETQNGFQETETWNYIEARLLNDRVLKEYKKIDSFWKKIIRLTGGSQWAKKLINRKKDGFIKRMEGMLYVTDHQVFFEGKRYHMCRNHNKITKVEELGNGIRITYGKKDEWVFVQNPKMVLLRLIPYVDRECLLRGGTLYESLKAEGRETEAMLYESIYIALLKLKDMVLVDKTTPKLKQQGRQILQMVLSDHPMLYYVNEEETKFVLEEQVMRIAFNYVYNQQQCEAMNSALLRRISQTLRDGIDCCGQDKELLKKWLYAYLEQKVTLVKDAPEHIGEEAQCRRNTVLGVFLDKKATYAGLKKAVKLLSDEIDVDNDEVHWNMKEGI